LRAKSVQEINDFFGAKRDYCTKRDGTKRGKVIGKTRDGISVGIQWVSEYYSNN